MRAVVAIGFGTGLTIGACMLTTDLAELDGGSDSAAPHGGSSSASSAASSAQSGGPALGGRGGDTGEGGSGGVGGGPAGGGNGGAAGSSSSSTGGQSDDCVGPHEMVIETSTMHCYYFDPAIVLGWNGAEAFCESLGPGWTLAAINSAVEQQLVTPALAPLTSVDVWIGGSDLASEGVYAWSNGEPWSYEFWDTGQPNDAPCGAVDQDCVEMQMEAVPPDGDFGDDCCNDPQPLLCERP